MLSRLSFVPRAVRVRRFSILDKLMNHAETSKQAAAIVDQPEKIKAAVEEFRNVMENNGGGMLGALIRNSPAKGVIEKMGGLDNLEKMMNDPAVQAKMREMMKDPVKVAAARAQVEKVFNDTK